MRWFFLIFLVFFTLFPQESRSEEVSKEFHLPDTSAEKSLDKILKAASEERDYREMLTPAFLGQHAPASGKGASSVCAPSSPESIPAYRTLNETKAAAVITVEMQGGPLDQPLYRMLREGDAWKLDGAYCDDDNRTNIQNDLLIEYCRNIAMTQAAMNMCEKRHADGDKALLDETLTQLEKRYANDPVRLKKLRKAQETWRAFVKAQLDLLYYDHDGSVAPMCRAMDIAYFTHLRYEQLKQWSVHEEGEVCGGL